MKFPLPGPVPVHGGGQLDMFEPQRPRFAVATAFEIEMLLRGDAAAVASSISGGKDSQALAYLTSDHLDKVGHTGPRVLVHADLGRVEWRDSLPVCERVASRLGAELLVVRRQAGDMMDRWLSRWRGNVQRYETLSCVRLILPWSTASTRFCTSALKAAPIASALRKRFPVGPLITAIGIRAEESRARANTAIWKPDVRTTRARGVGLAWHPLRHWTRQDVIDYIRLRGDVLHEAYRIFNSSRVSCAFCILASAADLRVSASCQDNHAIFREMVELEITSTFSFQSGKWLADVAPDLLDSSTRARLAVAKERSAAREAAEALIPQRLLYVKGWPLAVPDLTDARLLARVRRDVAAAVGLTATFTDAHAIRARFADLLRLKNEREGTPALDTNFEEIE